MKRDFGRSPNELTNKDFPPQEPFPIRERCFTYSEIATHYNVSYWKAREMFKDYLGVKKLGTPKPGKRVYQPVRIPESVLKRKDEEMTNGGA